MLTGKELGAAIESARQRKGVTKKAMADAFGVKPPSIQDWVLRGTIGKDKLPQLWAYFSDVVGPEHWGLSTYPQRGDQPIGNLASLSWGMAPEAQVLSLPGYKVHPLLEWHEVTTQGEHLPQDFQVEAPDDSMAPRAKRGQVVMFSRRIEAAPGDGVLVRDRHGNVYIRQYRQRRPGHWEAVALSDSYAPMDSQADGLVILAVVVGVQARWS